LLPTPGKVIVVGVAGDEIPVHQPQRTDLVPYTIWGEIAYQVGGEVLYRQVRAEATSHAAPGGLFFEQVLGGRKVLIMLDELAQYAARLEAARPNDSEQLAAFLLALHGYARNQTGIVIVLTLASQSDAFAWQTGRLTELISRVRGEEVTEDLALGMAEQAERGIRSVVARDAVMVVPVQVAEISRVLVQRLFDRIDRQAARETANDYMDMYRKSAMALPDRAVREDFREAMVAHYPFHPTFIDFLGHLSPAPTMSGAWRLAGAGLPMCCASPSGGTCRCPCWSSRSGKAVAQVSTPHSSPYL
jgi:predicted AAA+ superfamily ATPase